MRGPRSRAGLIAYPVGPPSELPIPITTKATAANQARVAEAQARHSDGFLAVTPGDTRIKKTSTKVPMTSVTVFQP